MLETKKVPCAGPDCADRRIHHELPDIPRGTQYVTVPSDYEKETAYCSITCAIMGGEISLRGAKL